VAAPSTLTKMELTTGLVAPCPPEAMFAWVEDLERYPQWLEIVTRVESEDDGGWAVDLRGRLGPLARSKRLRMVRSRHDPPTGVTFERAERDGRDHSPWILRADVAAHDEGAELEMRLHYGGGLFGPVIERVLRDEVERSRQRLLRLLTDS